MLAYQLTTHPQNSNRYLVLIHGYCLNKQCFSVQADDLKKYTNVLTVDLPGFGQTPPVSNITIEGMADEIYRLTAHMSIDKFVLMGHSMGGYVTLAFAKKYPQCLNGLGLINSTVAADTDERKDKRKQVIEFVNKYGIEPYLKTFIPELFWANSPATLKQQYLQLALTSTKEGVINSALAMMQREPSFELLQKTNLPVFFGIGRHDALINEKDLFHQASMVQKAKICYMQNSAHMGFAEEPERFNEAVKEFLDYCYDNAVG